MAIPLSTSPPVEETLWSDDNDSNYGEEDADIEEFITPDANEEALDELRYIIYRGRISQKITDMLLSFMKKHSTLQIPKSYTTLMGTPKNVDINSVAVGETGHYMHMGIGKYFMNIKHNSILSLDRIELDIGIDGIQFFASSKLKGWPIIGRVQGVNVVPPFLIGIYVGSEKPSSFDDYLAPLCDEYDLIKQENGVLINGKRIPLHIRAFVCDSPARCDVTSTHHHNHHNGCHKCIQPSTFENGARVYNSKIGTLRTDESFFNRQDLSHHSDLHGASWSRLELSNIRMVSQFPLDVMHQIDLGTTKTILTLIKTRKNMNPLLKSNIKKMSILYESYAKNTPREFARPPRSFSDLPLFKATELRQFTLYTGIVLFKSFLKPNMYLHFLQLACAYRQLSSNLYKDNLNLVQSQLLLFVKNFKKHYGKLGYNIHNLLHIVECVKIFGSVNSFSAYPFENFMSNISRLVRGKRFVLKQIYNRIHEFNRLNQKYGESESSVNQRFYSDNDKDCYIELPDCT